MLVRSSVLLCTCNEEHQLRCGGHDRRRRNTHSDNKALVAHNFRDPAKSYRVNTQYPAGGIKLASGMVEFHLRMTLLTIRSSSSDMVCTARGDVCVSSLRVLRM